MKKINLKRKMELLAAVILGISTLAACGSTPAESSGAENASGESASAENSGSERTEASQDTESEAVYPDYLNLDGYRPIVKEGEDVTLSIAVRRDTTTAVVDVEDMWMTHFIEEKLNINLDIEAVSFENAEEYKSLKLASGDLPDIILSFGITNDEIMQYGVDGELFLPISDYFSEELTPYIIQTMEEYPEARDAFTALDGKMYTLPKFNAVYPGKPGTTGNERFFIDTRYMDAIGMEEPPATLDELLEMLRAFRDLDPAAVGVDKIYPVLCTKGGADEYLRTIFGWIGRGVTVPVWDESEQAIVVPCLQEKYGEYIKLMHTLYSEGLLHPDYYTMDNTEVRALMAERKCAVLCDAAPYLAVKDGWADYIQAPPVTSEWCETPVSWLEMPYEKSNVYVSADTEYPELCLRLLDYIYSPEGSVYFTIGPVEGSEDTLGIVKGLKLSEDGNSYVSADVESGDFAENTYYKSHIRLGGGAVANLNNNYTELYVLELLGVENPQFRKMDLSNPDDHYRNLIYEAQNQYLVTPLPDVYMTAEQSARYADLKTVIDDYVTAETAKFVVGQRSIDEIDAFFEELKAMKGEEYWNLCQEVYAGYSR